MALKRRGSFARTLKSIEPDDFAGFDDGGDDAFRKNQWYFEIAWEVANKGEILMQNLLLSLTSTSDHMI